VTATVINTGDSAAPVNAELGVKLPTANEVTTIGEHTHSSLAPGANITAKFLVKKEDLNDEGLFHLHLGHKGNAAPGGDGVISGKFSKTGAYIAAAQCPGTESTFCEPTECCPGTPATSGKSFPCPVADFNSEDAKKCDGGWETVRDALMDAMTRDEKHRMLKGTGWFGDAFPKFRYYIGNSGKRQRFGIPTMNMQDSGNGFRNDVIETGEVGENKRIQQVTSWPVALALASLWSEDAMTAYGKALATEFRLKGANMLLGPAVNVHRVPRCGRNAEYLSGESPYLGLRLTKPYIRAVQSQRVLASVKHFINNNQENCRHTSNSISDDRTRWELYYPPFEAAVEADVAAQMCGYNLVNGKKNCQSREVMQVDLKDTMGFKGFVQSDWWALNNWDQAIEAGIDQEMPGHPGAGFDYYFTDDRLEALPVEQVNRMLKPQLEQMLKHGLLQVDPNTCEFGGRCDNKLYNNPVVGGVEGENLRLSRDTATKAVTLLKNEQWNGAPTLPLDKSKVKKIALLGSACHKLVDPSVMYTTWTYESYYFIGGSGRVVAHNPVTIYDGIREQCGIDDGHVGCYRESPLGTQQMKKVLWEGSTPEKCREACIADSSTHTHFGLQFYKECFCGTASQIGDKAPMGECKYLCDADKGVHCGGDNRNNIYTIEKPQTTPECEVISVLTDDVAEATQKAISENADVAITCAGAMSTESRDRDSLSLVEEDYVKQVAKEITTMPVIVLTMTPGAFVMPWRDDVQAMLTVFFPGQFAGNAFADNLFGVVNPSAKSPIAYPVVEETTIPPCGCEGTRPGSDIADCVYTEKLKIGWYGAKEEDILFPFGHGLSYTTFEYSNVNVFVDEENIKALCADHDEQRGDPVVCITATIANTGSRAGVEIAQLYIGIPEEEEPEKLLKGFNRLELLQPGGIATARFPVHKRDLQIYSNEQKKWVEQDGTFKVYVGSSAGVTPLTSDFEMSAGKPSREDSIISAGWGWRHLLLFVIGFGVVMGGYFVFASTRAQGGVTA